MPTPVYMLLSCKDLLFSEVFKKKLLDVVLLKKNKVYVCLLP